MKTLTKLSTRLMEKYLPDPFIFVILLSLVVFVLSMITTGSSPLQMTSFFGEGFWGLMEFTVQMSMVLLTGHVMAKSTPFKSLLSRLASVPNTAGQAIVLVSVVAALACFINWGFGLVLGVLFAKEVARQRDDTDYRLLIASGYSGFLVWHGGFSGSIPLTVATEGHPFVEQIGIILITDTVFTFGNLLIVALLVVTIPILNFFMHPEKSERYIIDPELLVEPGPEPKPENMTPAERLENSRVLNYIIGAIGIVYVIYHFSVNGLDLNLNIVNFIFLFTGLILHGTPRNYIEAVFEAVRGVGPILIQFPFYAGLMGMMVESGLAAQITEIFVSASNEVTFPLFAFLSAGVVNFFVPSGGGQWAVQAPVMIGAAMELGIEQSKMAMAVAWGDAWTNMIQPFWALPALAIAGLRARDIMGFCVWALVVSGFIIGMVMLFIF
ncbi:MAG TPA: short-chain fatty acid transporter [Candidatus Salinicoccus stercoripullorum]|uniref:Short-chain fatty acid transporter n=1 Tax=Candidatus Salinicoccus stercoripullorum TaxID=2838756 RepID=A0A9D1TZR7_9STAP|nr:short-chain fatty acid transporter [Candidatus Salinicoccus stercoripullorum]